MTLGRDPANSLVIGWDGSVSRRHARIFCHCGLFWLEDLGSKRGTFLTRADGQKRRVLPQQPALLLDGTSLRFGFQARFRMQGVSASSDVATRLLFKCLHQVLNELYAGLPNLAPREQEEQRARLLSFEALLRAVQSETESLRLTAALLGVGRLEPEIPSTQDLPPLPDLPIPGVTNQPISIRNVFITNIRRRFLIDEEVS
jgi:hypothetical protein